MGAVPSTCRNGATMRRALRRGSFVPSKQTASFHAAFGVKQRSHSQPPIQWTRPIQSKQLLASSKPVGAVPSTCKNGAMMGRALRLGRFVLSKRTARRHVVFGVRLQLLKQPQLPPQGGWTSLLLRLLEHRHQAATTWVGKTRIGTAPRKFAARATWAWVGVAACWFMPKRRLSARALDLACVL